MTIFDPKIIIDGANYTDIKILPRGISYVIQEGGIAEKHNCVVDYMLIQNNYNIISAVNAMALVFVLVYAAALVVSVYKKNKGGDDDEK